MLVIEINDSRLERKIIEKARIVGKSVQDLLRDFVIEKIQEDNKTNELPFDIPKLDYRQHIKTIDFGIKDSQELDKLGTTLFVDIDDAGEYVHNLRRTKR